MNADIRGGGRTHRQVLQALEYADLGAFVAFVWPVRITVDYPFRMAAGIVGRMPESISINPSRRLIQLGNYGSVRFVSLDDEPDDIMMGYPDCRVILDHACSDCLGRAYSAWITAAFSKRALPEFHPLR